MDNKNYNQRLDEDLNLKRQKNLKIFLIIIAVIFFVFAISFVGYFAYNTLFKSDALHSFFLKFNNFPGISSSSNVNDQKNSNNFNSNNPKVPSLAIEDYPDSKDSALSAQEVYKKASVCVVGVEIYDKGAALSEDAKGEGSGIVISSDGYIVTNAHVIGSSKDYGVKVVMSDSSEYAAKIVGYDNITDIAVLKIDPTIELTAATFGNSDQLSVGEWVIAIGNPGGLNFANSLTRGVVSALNRSVSTSQNSMGYIQTDAAINPGNSGGALLNMYGQVVGINSSKVVSTSYEGMGFAIPINTAKKVVDDLISQGYVSGRVRLGITGKVVSEYQAGLYNVPQGIVIVQVAPESDLCNKGVESGDIITKLDGADITDFNTLNTELSKHSVGDTVKLTIYRQKSNKLQASTFEISVTLLENKGQS